MSTTRKVNRRTFIGAAAGAAGAAAVGPFGAAPAVARAGREMSTTSRPPCGRPAWPPSVRQPTYA
jgi:hypothetical protein